MPRTTFFARATASSALPAETLVSLMSTYSLSEQFNDWLGVIKGVDGISGQEGEWNEAGKVRILDMSDGTTTTEKLVRFEADGGWTNELSLFTNKVKTFMKTIDDAWYFVSTPTGTQITWQWTFHELPDLKSRLITRLVIVPLHKKYLQDILNSTLSKVEALVAAQTSNQIVGESVPASKEAVISAI